MAWHYVREGWVAVVVDNAGAGEQGTLDIRPDAPPTTTTTWRASCWKWTRAGWATSHTDQWHS